MYGVVAHGVAQRRIEFGIRLALGASPRALGALVFGQDGALAGAGVACGLLGAWALARGLSHALPRVAAPTPGLFVGLAIGMVAVTLLASWLPARRAARVDPLVALCSE